MDCLKKKSGRWLPLLFLMMLLTAALPAAVPARAQEPVSASRAVKETVVLKKKNSRYYGYINETQVKNAWKTVAGAKYYFNKKGQAVTGSVLISGSYYIFGKDGKLQKPKKVTALKIGKIWYRVKKNGKAAPGWDSAKTYYYAKNGARVKNGWSADGKYYLGSDGKKVTGTAAIAQTVTDEFGLKATVVSLYAFGAKGKKDAALTARLQAASVYEKDFSELKALLGEPVSSGYSRGCYDGPASEDGRKPYAGGQDGMLKYKGFVVMTYKAPSGEEFFQEVKLP